MRQLKLIIAAVCLISPYSASAAFIYDFSFGEISIDGVIYQADGFSFQTPDLITFGETANLSPAQSLNGLTFNAISVCGIASNFLIYCGPFDFNRPIGSIADFQFGVDFGGPSRLGTFLTNDAFRGIRMSNGITYFATSGQLTISEVSVPEPGTLALFGLGLAGMGITRRKKKV